jgi:shikimate kinase
LNIILIGYRCSGKTTVGKRLARELAWEFVDTDDWLVNKEGRSVRNMVEDDGWDGFRRMEKVAIQEVCDRDNTVIATGGGAILDPANVAAMQKSGHVVWLKVSPQIVKQRMARDENTDDLRPSLTSKGLYDEIVEVLKERTPLYAQAAGLAIDTDSKTVDEVVEEIIKGFKVSRGLGFE